MVVILTTNDRGLYNTKWHSTLICQFFFYFFDPSLFWYTFLNSGFQTYSQGREYGNHDALCQTPWNTEVFTSMILFIHSTDIWELTVCQKLFRVLGLQRRTGFGIYCLTNKDSFLVERYTIINVVSQFSVESVWTHLVFSKLEVVIGL